MEETAELLQEEVKDKPDVLRIFKLQRSGQQRVANTSAAERVRKLNGLYDALMKYRDQIREALYKDYRKPAAEVDLVEIYPVVSEIRYTRRRLARWMRPQRVDTPLVQVGTTSHVHYEPKGVSLIISPWNFPLNLTLGPLVAAIAAGNCVMIKPSEFTPHISSLMKKMISELFDESEVALIEGDHEVASELLGLPFNHIYFTGSPEIGKIVMRAAADNLASVTLELGGKSPTIVDPTADLDTAARRISFVKWINNGQVCISPDHVYVHRKVADKFLEKMKSRLNDFYSGDASDSDSYARILNGSHVERMKGYLEDAISKGAQVQYGGRVDPEENYVEPTILTSSPGDADIDKEEIFGPILPVYIYDDLDEVLNSVNLREKPLALYLYSSNKKTIQKVMKSTRAGATCINHNGIHFFNFDLPFGGVNNSGMGKGHGFYGFLEFSNQRATLRQWSPWSILDLLTPPYTNVKQRIIDLAIKWF